MSACEPSDRVDIVVDRPVDRRLLVAAASGSRSEIADALLAGAAIECVDQRGYSALHHAAVGGHREAAALLLDSGAGLEVRTRNGSTPLHKASEKGRVDVVRLFLSRGAVVDARTVHASEPDFTARTPLHEAARAGQVEAAIVLLESGADPNAVNGSGKTPRALALEHGREEVARLLMLPITSPRDRMASHTQS